MVDKARQTGRRSSMAGVSLRESILAGDFRIGGFLPSVRQLSKSYRMATETVRRALKAIEAEGYLISVPRQGFRVLRGPGVLGKGVAVAYAAYHPDSGAFLWDDFHTTLLAKFQETAVRRGWSLLTVNWSEATREDLVHQVRLSRVAGVILDYRDDALLALLERAGLPAVLIDAWEAGLSVDTVAQDGFVGGYVAAAHLAQSGHRRIGWLGAESIGGSLQIVERYGGAVCGLRRAGLLLDEALCRTAPLNDAESARRGALELLDRSDRPTAILALWQDMTEGVVRAAEALGLVPGRDFDMVGWSTEEDYEHRHVSLFRHGPAAPAIVWRIASMAEAAVRCILHRRSDPAAPPMLLRIPTRLLMPGGEAGGSVDGQRTGRKETL